MVVLELKQSPRYQLHQLVGVANNMGIKCPFVATENLAKTVYHSINSSVFSNALIIPKIIVRDYKHRQIWGECEGLQRGSRWGPYYTKAIRLQKHWPNFKKFISVVAHEMVHQWEWEYHGVMTHGYTTFFAWEEKLRSRGIRLCISM